MAVETSFMRMTPKHQLLKKYDGKLSCLAGRTVVIAGNVQDGVGDFVHLTQVVEHCVRLRKESGQAFQLCVLTSLDQERLDEDKLLAEKFHKLESIVGQDSVYSSIDKNKLFSAYELWSQEKPCLINVSFPFLGLPRSISVSGFISEYMWNKPDSQLDNLCTGFRSDETFGLFLEDPVFGPPAPVSDATKILLFGSLPTDEEMKKWTVGFGALKTGIDRHRYVDLRLSQVPGGKNCSIVLSPANGPVKTDVNQLRASLFELATGRGFDCCVFVDSKQMFIQGNQDLTGRVLRIIYQFIPEEDLAGVIQMAKEGSIAGSGDTACIHALIGQCPMFIGDYVWRNRWRLAVNYCRAIGFQQVANWIQFCINTTYQPIEPLSDELMKEWSIFRVRALKELDIGPWLTRYLCRCAAISSLDGEKIKNKEAAFFRKRA